MMKRGLFITIEKTGEGLGGSTQALRLHRALKNLGINTKLTREPGATTLGEQLRSILLESKNTISKASELLLFTACRAQLYEEVLKPALDNGLAVVCDRYIDTTLAYQGAGRGWNTEVILQLHHLATGSLFPDITFVLDGVPHRFRSQEDRFESLDDEFYQKVKDRMLHLTSTSNRYVLINANQPEEVITNQMICVLKERFSDFFKASSL